MNLREVSPEQTADFRRTVEQDFPGDAMLQEVHLARLILEERMRDLSTKEKVAFLNQNRERRTRAA
jgi:hypothetical protein